MPVFNIFKKLCDDENDRSVYTASSYNQSSSNAVKTYTTTTTSGVVTSYSYNQTSEPQEESIYNSDTAVERDVKTEAEAKIEAKPEAT